MDRARSDLARTPDFELGPRDGPAPRLVRVLRAQCDRDPTRSGSPLSGPFLRDVLPSLTPVAAVVLAPVRQPCSRRSPLRPTSRLIARRPRSPYSGGNERIEIRFGSPSREGHRRTGAATDGGLE